MKDFPSHFGLRAIPFTRELEVSKRFQHPQFQEALDALREAIEKRMSAALIAPAGTGKTALLRALVAQLPAARYRIHYVKVTSLSRRDMCREIAAALGHEPRGTFAALVRALQDYFLAQSDDQGLRPLLILDDAHEMLPEVLGILRLLTNFDMDSRLVLSVLLCGQAPLGRLLRRDDLDDVAHRLAHYARLQPLSREEAKNYVEHRCRVSGARTSLFDDSAQEALFEIARGNLRAIDHLALKSLEYAHRAKASVVDTNHVTQARSAVCP